MSEFKLVAKTALGFDQPLAEEWPGFSVSEIAGLSVWWISVAEKGVGALAKACEKQLGTGLPEKGRYAQAENGTRILWAGDHQWFVTGELAQIPAALEKAAAVTDQSDGWIAVRIAGDKTREVMEKLCMLDLHPSVFPAGASARTPIEGMHALIACEDAGAGTFVLYFQRSSGRSFVDHIRHAAHGTCPRD